MAVVDPRKPKWIRSSWQQTDKARSVRRFIREHNLHTVCEESNCPNRGECYNNGTCSLLIMGPVCTRYCRFCDVEHGAPHPLDPDEPRQAATTVQKLGIRFVVITSVDRDDIPDGSAAHFAQTIREIHKLNPGVSVEVLTPDFQMDKAAIDTVLEAKPEVFAHNVETVRRLTRQVRDQRATYDQSMEVLAYAHKKAPSIPVKSGMMVGLGESDDEVLETLKDIRDTGAVSITIGQYLRPTKEHLPVDRYVKPVLFREYETAARKMGFRHVASGPIVRSSYHAEELAALNVK